MPQSATTDLFLTIAMLAVVALVWGGVHLLRRGGDRKQPMLMFAAALVLFGNILIWSL